MRQIIIQKGRVNIEEVPAPQIEPGTVLVAVSHSCISAGTEMSGINSGAKPLWKRAFEQPDKVKKAINMALSDGVTKTKDRVQNAVSSGRPTGYSLAGTVIEVGENVHDIRPDDLVACAGGQFAHHAEIVRVPRNLVVPFSRDISFAEASTVTLGAISLQGVRRLNPTLGESFVVIGLGILGQLTVQLLRANGCRVMGVDLDSERVKIARNLGMNIGIDPTGNQIDQILRLTDGIGADGIVVTAATPSSEVLSTAFKMCRKKGRVVLVGDVGLNINRKDIYAKELDFFISTSYGPGRYDQKYEEHGLDYPVSYVRWTENRNMSEYLRLVGQGIVNVKELISAVYPIDDAPAAYADLQKPDAKPLIALLSYPQPKVEHSRKVDVVTSKGYQCSGKIRVAVVGAGGFAKNTHLPNLKKLSEFYDISAICSRTGYNAKSTAEKFGADYATTDFEQILADSDVDAVIIATKHHLHAQMTLKAINAGKHVLVEKPLSINQNELDAINDFYSDKPDGPVLLTGFNRRFSNHMKKIKEITDKRINPMIISYRMNAGYIPLDHWVHGTEGGGRNIGEACHIYDLFTFLTNAGINQLNARAIRPKTGYYGSRDNFICTTSFDDGSVASLIYTALGSKDYPKEMMEIYLDGKVLTMENYEKVVLTGAMSNKVNRKSADKGFEEELRLFAASINGDSSWPNPLWQQIQAMEMAFSVDELLVQNS